MTFHILSGDSKQLVKEEGIEMCYDCNINLQLVKYSHLVYESCKIFETIQHILFGASLQEQCQEADKEICEKWRTIRIK